MLAAYPMPEAIVMEYFDRAGRPVGRDAALALFGDADSRRVAFTELGDVQVSTVHLVMDHQYGSGPPLIFETMIFGGEHDDDCWRYSTEQEAAAGHERIVAALRAGTDPDA